MRRESTPPTEQKNRTGPKGVVVTYIEAINITDKKLIVKVKHMLLKVPPPRVMVQLQETASLVLRTPS